MRLGLINQLHGGSETEGGAPTWESVSARAAAAEGAGFDVFVFEDALIYRSTDATYGVWESMTVAAALAVTTSKIKIGQSVVNSPYRAPALTASMASTLDEISGGRYVFGIGAGNTEDYDYEAFGFPTDRRFSRFAEAIEIIHGLLKRGHVDFSGEFYEVKESELVLRGPNSSGPPINIAAGGPKMLRLAARYADEWNWWSWDETIAQLVERFSPILENLDQVCEEEERVAKTLVRTLDVYGVVIDDVEGDHGFRSPISGSPDEIAGQLLERGAMGFDEIRVDVWPKTVEAIEAMAPIVVSVHGAD